MTRVYERPNTIAVGATRTRALVIGAGRYPHAKGTDPTIPILADLTSVGPSVRDFVTRLIQNWRDDLAAPLGSVDLLLSEAGQAGAATWSALGVDGEAPNGTPLGEASLGNVKAALGQVLQGAEVQDHLLVLCCGHGFWREQRCFVLSDFGADVANPWTSVVALDDFVLGLRQKKPRHQWLFLDCCSDMPDAVLEALGRVGDPLVQPTRKGLLAAQQQFGAVSQFGLASSAIGTQAFGLPNQPSRFCEVLVDAIDGAGAIERDRDQVWWVDQYGIVRAVQCYVDRMPELDDPEFYEFVIPTLGDAPGRMLLRRLAQEPMSRLVASSIPAIHLKHAPIVIRRKDANEGSWDPPNPPRSRAKLHIDLPARHHYTVTATFDGAPPRQVEVFANLPMAEPAEFIL